MHGKDNHFLGKKHTDETREKMSIAKKGKSYEEIYGDNALAKKQNVSNKLKGRVFNSETLLKMRTPKGPQKRIICEHCGREGGISNMTKYHGEKCKFKDVNK